MAAAPLVTPGPVLHHQEVWGKTVENDRLHYYYDSAFWDSEIGYVVVASDINKNFGTSGFLYGTPGVFRFDSNGNQVGVFTEFNNRHTTKLIKNLWSHSSGDGDVLLSYPKYTSEIAEEITVEKYDISTVASEPTWRRVITGSLSLVSRDYDNSGGMFVLYTGTLDGGSTGLYLQHFDSNGEIWAVPVLISAFADGEASVYRGPIGGVYILSDSVLHLIYSDGRRAWGEMGRSWFSDWTILNSDETGGLIVGRDFVGTAQPVPTQLNRVDSELAFRWDPESVVLSTQPGAQPSGHGFSCFSDARGGLFFATKVTSVAGAYSSNVVVDSGGSQDSTYDLNLVDSGVLGVGNMDGFDGAVYLGFESGYDPGLTFPNYKDLTVMRAGDPSGREAFSIRGRVVERLGAPVSGATVKINNGDTLECILTTVTDSDGNYEIAGVPAFQDIRITVESEHGTSPEFYSREVITGDFVADFYLKRPVFYDVTGPPVQGFERVTNAADWVDYDSDGDLDLYLSYGEYLAGYWYEASNKLVQSDGGGFVDVTPGSSLEGIGFGGPTISAAWADMDNDGDQDLYISNGDEVISESVNVLFENESVDGPSFTRFSNGDIGALEDASPGGRAEWVDLDGDGDLDLFVGRPNRTPLLFKSWYSNFGNTFDLVGCPGLTGINGTGFFSWGDYDGDRLVDVFLFGAGGNNYLLRNNGDWTFSDVTSAAGVESQIGGIGKAAAWGDFDNDGDVDLVVGYGAQFAPSLRLFRNSGNVFEDITSEVQLPHFSEGIEGIGWSDIENDGDLDLVVSGQPTIILENMFPDQMFEWNAEFQVEVAQKPRTISIADYDGDGDEDLYVGIRGNLSVTSDLSRLYRNDYGHLSNWFALKLKGVHSNKDGIGSQVTVHMEDGSIQYRQLLGAVGGNSHAPKVQSIGLGTNTQANRVSVVWPTGRVSEVPHVQSGETITITDEFPALQGGSVYLTADSTGAVAGQTNGVGLWQLIDVYLAADLTAMVGVSSQLGGIESKLIFPERVNVISEEILNGGVDLDPEDWSYSLNFDQGVPTNLGPIPLVHLQVMVMEEGRDPSIAIGNIASPAFSDPIEADVPSWTDHSSQVLYRLEDPANANSFTIPIDDSKSPTLSHTGLWLGFRSRVLVTFDEPIHEDATNGLSRMDVSHYRVYNVPNPATTKTVVSVSYADERSVILFLDSEIRTGKDFNVEISNMQDFHGNSAGVVDGIVTTIGDGGGGVPGMGFNEVMTGPSGTKSGLADLVYWVEVVNESDRSISLNGWTVEVAGGALIAFPDSPIMILQPSELGLMAGNGYLPDLTAPEDVVYHSEDTFGEDTGLLIVSNPFGDQTDSVNTGTMLKSGRSVGTSLQRFVEAANKSTYWVADAPEYSEGLRGTPGKVNRTASEELDKPELPSYAHSALLYAAPNPFNPMTSIYLVVKERGNVSVVVYDLRGRKVRTLYDQFSEPRAQMKLEWNGTNDSGARVSSGVYFVKMIAPDTTPEALKILLLK